MRQLTLRLADKKLSFTYQEYKSQRAFRTATRAAFGPNDPCGNLGFTRLDTDDVTTHVTLVHPDILTTVEHECSHAAEFAESWLVLPGIDPSEFRAYMSSGLTRFILAETQDAKDRALAEINKAFATEEELYA